VCSNSTYSCTRTLRHCPCMNGIVKPQTLLYQSNHIINRLLLGNTLQKGVAFIMIACVLTNNAPLEAEHVLLIVTISLIHSLIRASVEDLGCLVYLLLDKIARPNSMSSVVLYIFNIEVYSNAMYYL
jgi:hypothetical protein